MFLSSSIQVPSAVKVLKFQLIQLFVLKNLSLLSLRWSCHISGSNRCDGLHKGIKNHRNSSRSPWKFPHGDNAVEMQWVSATSSLKHSGGWQRTSFWWLIRWGGAKQEPRGACCLAMSLKAPRQRASPASKGYPWCMPPATPQAWWLVMASQPQLTKMEEYYSLMFSICFLRCFGVSKGSSFPLDMGRQWFSWELRGEQRSWGSAAVHSLVLHQRAGGHWAHSGDRLEIQLMLPERFLPYLLLQNKIQLPKDCLIYHEKIHWPQNLLFFFISLQMTHFLLF